MKTYLITDLDGTLIKTKSGLPRPQNKNDWQFIIALDELKQFDGVYVVTNQSDKRYTQYIRNVKFQLSDDIVEFHESDKYNKYRKPHSTIFEEYIMDKIDNDSSVIFLGDQITDYYFACNCNALQLHHKKNLHCEFRYELHKESRPLEVKDNTFESDPPIELENKKYVFYCYNIKLLDTFIKHYNLTLIGSYKSHSKLKHESGAIIYFGKANSIKTADKYIMVNTEDISNIIENYYSRVYNDYYKPFTYKVHYDDTIKLMPILETEYDKLLFNEFREI